MKRLFLFAFYDPQGTVGETALRYLEALQACGDVILAADCDLADREVEKLRPLARVVWTGHHGEYDFGSYKRAFQAASLADYDVLYLVNDSVIGPLYPLRPYLEKMEGLGCEAFGMSVHPSRLGVHLQSWFMGFRPGVFLSPWFSGFLSGIHALPSKEDVCIIYETGVSVLLQEHGVPYAALYRLRGKKVYDRVWPLYRDGFPFFKKSALERHGGSLGGQVKRILDRVDPDFAAAVRSDADRLYGAGYADRFLTTRPWTLVKRYLTYLLHK